MGGRRKDDRFKQSEETGLICGLCGSPIQVGVVQIQVSGIVMHQPCWFRWPGSSNARWETPLKRAKTVMELMQKAQEVYGGVDALEEAIGRYRVRLEGGKIVQDGGR